MRFLLIILFVSTVLADEQIAKNADKGKPELKKSIEEPKSKTGKRDSSDQTGSYGVNPNDEPFKPMLSNPTPFVAAASDTQQVYYDKNPLVANEGAGNAKGATNPSTPNAYRAQYSQVVHPQQQQQPNKNHIRIAAKNEGLQQQQQQQNQPNILYGVPQIPAYHYERVPQQQLQVPAPPSPSQKPTQYVIAIPLSHLRHLQQQIIHHQQQQQQQQEQPSHLQVYKGQQQPQYQQQQQLQQVPVYTMAGPLARDHHGSYRPFHRFAPTAVHDGQHQTGSSSAIPQSIVSASPALPGYVTQYVQIPASALLAAMQTAQTQQQLQQRPVGLTHHLYQQQPQPQLQYQPTIQQQHQQQQQQHVQTSTPQLYYYQPQQQQVQLKQSQPSHASTSPPVYAFNVNQLQQQQQQQQQPSQQHQSYQHLTEQQQVNVGKQPHRVRGVRPVANLTPNQYYSSTAEANESEEKARFAKLHSSTQTNLNAHTLTNAHSQQYVAQAPEAQQQHQHQQHTAPAPQQIAQTQTPESYEHVVHFNPQYLQQYQEQHQPQHQLQQLQRQSHRLQIQQPHQHTPFMEHLNNLPFSQGIHGPTPLSFLRLQPATAEAPFYSLNMATPHAIPQSVISGGAFQPSFSPLGMPSKVTSFTNVLLQPFVGHPSSFQTPEIGTAVAGSAESIPYLQPNGGIRYGTHLYHPPTLATTILADNKEPNVAAHPDPRVLTTTKEAKVTASSTKSSVAGRPTIVKYP